MLEIRSDTKENRLVVTLNGRIDSFSSMELEEKLLGLIDSNQSDLILDCTAVPYVCSAGLRIFLMVAKKAKTFNWRICLVGSQLTVLDVFEMTGLTTMFETHSTLVDALPI